MSQAVSHCTEPVCWGSTFCISLGLIFGIQNRLSMIFAWDLMTWKSHKHNSKYTYNEHRSIKFKIFTVQYLAQSVIYLRL